MVAATQPATGVAARALDVWKVYGTGEAQVIALRGVSLDLERGRYTAIMGPSGSGKSTLMHCLAGLDTLTSGQALIGGTDLAGRTPDPAWLETVVDKLNLADRLRHRPSELSGGQQQRVAVGRALISQPEVVFADEPTGALDSKASTELLQFLRSVVDDLGQTVVMVTHDPGAAAYADRVVFLADGAVVEELVDPSRERVLEIMGRLGD